MAGESNTKPLASPLSQASTISVGSPQVPIWTIPFHRNPFFTGREEILSQLHSLLQNTSTAALSQPLAMSGLGGIGKTQTAVEYAHLHRDEYQVVCWIKSSTSEELADNFASIARILQLPEQQDQEQAYIIMVVKRWFEIHSGWLLIFDNADDLAILSDYIPENKKGHVLITTRAHAMGELATKIEMNTLKRDEGVHLLLHRAKLITRTTPLEQVKDADLKLSYRIFEELGGLPLALDQAGGYIEETNESLSSYLMLYEDQRADLLQRRGGLNADHAPVATTWNLAFRNLEDRNPTALELIRLCAFLAPDEIPEELLTRTAHLLSPPLQSISRNQTRFNEAIQALLSYSLIQRDPISKTLSMHRLIQAVIKDEMRKTQRSHWAGSIVQMISEVFPYDEAGPWTHSQRYLPHALLAVEYINQWTLTSTEARTLLNKLGFYFKARGQYSEAESLLQDNRIITEKRFGPNHPIRGSSLNDLGYLYIEQGKYEQAEQLLQHALSIKEQHLGPDHPDIGLSLTNLGYLYTKQGKYEQAESQFQHALAIFEKRLGSAHPKIADCLRFFVTIYEERSRFEQAEPMLQNALDVFEQHLGSAHPKTTAIRERYELLRQKLQAQSHE